MRVGRYFGGKRYELLIGNFDAPPRSKGMKYLQDVAKRHRKQGFSVIITKEPSRHGPDNRSLWIYKK